MKRSQVILLILAVVIAGGVIYMTQSPRAMTGNATMDNNSQNSNMAPIDGETIAPAPSEPAPAASEPVPAAPAPASDATPATSEPAPIPYSEAPATETAPMDNMQSSTPVEQIQQNMDSTQSNMNNSEAAAVDAAATAGAAGSNPEDTAQTTR